MASNFVECPTGILIEFVGNTTTSNSHFTEKGNEDNLNGKAHKVESSHGKEETSGCQTPFMNIGACTNLGNSCLGAELTTKKDEIERWSGWRTPSPTTMNMISEEASRIVDQLDTSLEISLWDEEFPLSTLEEDCSEEHCESEVLSQNVESSLNSNTLSYSVNVIKRDIPIKNELVAKCLSTSKEDFNPLKENNIVTKETCLTLGYQRVLTFNFNVTETNSDFNNNAGSSSITERSSGTTKKSSSSLKKSSCKAEERSDQAEENSGAVEEKFGAAGKKSSAAEENSGTDEENSGAVEEKSGATKGRSSVGGSFGPTEAKCGALQEISGSLEVSSGALDVSSGALEVSSGALEGGSEGSSKAVEGSSGALKGSSESLEESCNANNKNCNANNKNCNANEKHYVNGSEEKSYDKVETNSGCAIIKENSFISKENCTVTEENKEVTVANCRMISNVRDSEGITNNAIVHVDMKERHLSSESIVNENSMKSTPSKSSIVISKLGKVFKDPPLKTPLKYNKAKEKENIFQASRDKNALPENKNCKIEQFSSAKRILGESNINESKILTSKSNIKTPLSKRIFGKIPFVRGENKPSMNMLQDQTKEIIKQSNVPLKSMNTLQYPPTSSVKTPLRKSNSVIDTPNLTKPIRRSHSFQTRPSIENFNQVKREKSFVAVSHLKTLNSRSLHQTARIGSELNTPSKNLSFLPKSNTFATPFASNAKSCAKVSQIACPSFGSALKQINTPIPNSKQVVDFKRPASTTSKSRFASRLELPSPSPKVINDSLPRRLFPDNTPKKRFN